MAVFFLQYVKNHMQKDILNYRLPHNFECLSNMLIL
jgi:hypothetical protein